MPATNPTEKAIKANVRQGILTGIMCLLLAYWNFSDYFSRWGTIWHLGTAFLCLISTSFAWAGAVTARRRLKNYRHMVRKIAEDTVMEQIKAELRK